MYVDTDVIFSEDTRKYLLESMKKNLITFTNGTCFRCGNMMITIKVKDDDGKYRWTCPKCGIGEARELLKKRMENK